MGIDYAGIARERDLVFNGKHLPYKKSLVEFARQLRKNMTKAERMLWYEVLRHLPVSALRQRPIDRYIVDFYIPNAKLVIELDGEHHFTEEGKQYDGFRDEILRSYGLTVLRIENQDVLYDLDGVRRRIEKLVVEKAILR